MKINEKEKRKPLRQCLSIETNNRKEKEKVKISVLLAYHRKTRDFRDLFKILSSLVLVIALERSGVLRRHRLLVNSKR